MSRRQCTGISKRTGKPCGEQPMRGRDVCYHHGAMTPRGIASPHTITGRYSKHLPTRMAARYQEAQADPELLVLRDEIALLDSRLADVLARVDSGESGALWKQLSSSWSVFVKARASGKVDEMRDALATHESLIDRGLADYAAWAEIGQLLDRRARFVESERRRYVEMQQMVSVEQAMLFLGAVTDAIRRHVTDRPTLAALGRELELLADAQPQRLPPGKRRAG
jgi:hypothetical protein